MPPPFAIHHVAIKVDDLARAESFWSGVLGLDVLRRQSDDLGARSLWFGLEHEVFLAVERAEAPGPLRPDEAPGIHCVALSIAASDREKWRSRLVHAGFPVFRETDYTLYVREQSGAVIALSHYPTAWSEPHEAGES